VPRKWDVIAADNQILKLKHLIRRACPIHPPPFLAGRYGSDPRRAPLATTTGVSRFPRPRRAKNSTGSPSFAGLGSQICRKPSTPLACCLPAGGILRSGVQGGAWKGSIALPPSGRGCGAHVPPLLPLKGLFPLRGEALLPSRIGLPRHSSNRSALVRKTSKVPLASD